MPKRFLRLFFAVFLALTALFAGTIYVVDPYYHYHGPVAGLPLWLQDGRYQNVGAAEKINTIILGNLSSKVNRLTKKEQDPAEPCRFRQDLGIVIGAVWWPP